jgi:predicted nucleic acid-binding protein
VILVDTSVWIDHFSHADEVLAALLVDERVLTHAFVIGELALDSLPQRDAVLHELNRLPRASMARDNEVMRFINQERLFGSGLGYVDVHLLAAVRLTQDASLWTRDKRLLAAAERLSLAARVVH